MARPRIYDNADELEKVVDEYFSLDGKKTLTGLALHLGFDSRQSIYDYQKNGTFSYIINKALLRVENQYEENLSGNNVAGSIFVLKNMGWKDKSEVEQSGGLTLNWSEERTYETK
jgi:N12 class adenine-specific DNA methylase